MAQCLATGAAVIMLALTLPPCLGQGLLLIPLGATGSLAQEHLGIFLSQPLCLFCTVPSGLLASVSAADASDDQGYWC